MNRRRHSNPMTSRRRPAAYAGDVVENDEFAAFAQRIIRAHGRRVATGDVEALRDLVALSTVLDQAILRGRRSACAPSATPGPKSADRLGITRQAAQQRWGGDQP